MSEIHIRQIRATLKKEFAGLIDVSDYDGRPEEERASAFLTRALAAFALVTVSGVDVDQAAAAVVDGGQDNGIDAILPSAAERILYVVQSKWRHDGSGSMDRGDILKLITGFRDLINGRFERFNQKLRAKSTEVLSALNDAGTRMVIVVAYTGQEPLSPEVARDLQDTLDELNNPTDVVSLKVLRQANIYSAVAEGVKGAPVALEVVLYDWGQVREPYFAVYGQVSASDVSDWWQDHYPRLFAPNIRMFLGETDVNESLMDTLGTSPERFWYYNNGITVLSASVKKKPIGGDSRDMGIFECADFRVVNGAQTIGAIATASASHQDFVAKARVPIRIISLEQCPEGFDREVTRCTNTQNKIDRRDFVALDVEQERLRGELQLEDVAYAFKSGDVIPRGQTGFDIIEATVALACRQPDLSLAVQAKREIGKLWEDIERPPYKVLFNPSVESADVWKAVQVLRVVEDQLAEIRKGTEGREQLLAIHGNRFIAHAVFQRRQKEFDEAPASLSPDLQALIRDSVQTTYAQALTAVNQLFPDGYLASVFKNLGRCRQLRDAIQ
jgi:hypothetical protein